MANEVAEVKQKTIGQYLGGETVHKSVVAAVGEKDSQKFISSVISAVQTNPDLAKCTNESLLSAALLGHSLGLPQSPQIGMFYFVPYKNKSGVTEAQFQISYRGMLQLAMRSGQYKKIHVTDIRQGELDKYNPITDEYEFNPETDIAKRETLPVIGYYAYFELVNGFKKALYWSKEKMDAHAKQYSVSYRKGWNTSLWITDFDKMAYKTMLRQLISKYGAMSVEMQNAYASDMAVLDENGNPNYVDNVADDPTPAVDVMETVDVESVEVVDGEVD